MPWLSFDGVKGLSSHEFVQKVQRTTFQQGKQGENEWVAHFAATCFSGEALEWYIGLDEETQTSWRKLRAGLIQRWPIQSGKTSSDVDPANIPAPAPATIPPHSLLPTSNKVLLGVIKVVYDTQSLGYVTLDEAGTCIIQEDDELALVVGRPQQLNAAVPCKISIVSPSAFILAIYYSPSTHYRWWQEGPEDVKASIVHMPYLGLSLFRRLGKDPDTVPSEIPYSPDGDPENPIPSSLCRIPRFRFGARTAVHPLATWYISPCSKGNSFDITLRRTYYEANAPQIHLDLGARGPY